MSFKVTIRDKDRTPELEAFIRKVQNRGVNVGVFTDSSAEKAHDAEFGNSENNVPVRAFMRKSIEVMGDKVITLRTLLGPAIRTKNMFDFYEHAGKLFAGIMRSMVETATFWAESNAPSTIERKGHNMPLRDTDEMLNDITYQIAKVQNES